MIIDLWVINFQIFTELNVQIVVVQVVYPLIRLHVVTTQENYNLYLSGFHNSEGSDNVSNSWLIMLKICCGVGVVNTVKKKRSSLCLTNYVLRHEDVLGSGLPI
jgi:hypothetical protein